MANPYRHLQSKVRGLLMTEAKLSKEERENNQWQLLFTFAKTQVIIGKGGINTIFYQFGKKGKRHVCYPDQILDMLEQLAKQKHWRYIVRDASGAPVKTSFNEQQIMKAEPVLKHTISGVTDEGETVLFVGGANAEGPYWKKHGTKKSNA